MEVLKAAQRAEGFLLSNIQVNPKIPKLRDDRHASQLNVLTPILHPALLCIAKPQAKDFLAPWDMSLCLETGWLLYPSFMLEVNDSAVIWGFFCLPSTWCGKKHRETDPTRKQVLQSV